jgi:hypothetical protein
MRKSLESRKCDIAPHLPQGANGVPNEIGTQLVLSKTSCVPVSFPRFISRATDYEPELLTNWMPSTMTSTPISSGGFHAAMEIHFSIVALPACRRCGN